MDEWQNRIVGSGVERPEDLLASPRNWRIHPKHQQDAMKGVLEQIGWVQQIIVNQRTQFVVDGHLRVAIAISEEQAEVPVIYVDLSDEEEAMILATFDPISALAVTDLQGLRTLTEGLNFQSSALERTVTDLLADSKPPTRDDAAPAAGETPPENALTWGYATFGKTRINCASGEIDAIQEAYQSYRSEHGGTDVGFVRWLAEGRLADAL